MADVHAVLRFGNYEVSMQTNDLDILATLRLLIGFLGEKGNFSWWESSFFVAGSKAFLAPVFPRTRLLAQHEGVTRAAALKHDDRIGVGDVCHLFRLPEDVEQGLHRVLQDSAVQDSLATHLQNRDLALSQLIEIAGTKCETAAGPVCVGGLQDLRETSTWRTVAAQYAHAFDQGIQVYPYFSDRP